MSTNTFSTTIKFKRLIIPSSCDTLKDNVFNCKGDLTIIYLGSTNFSSAQIFSPTLTKVKIYVTPYYTEEYFGNVEVIRNWINEPQTNNQKHFPIFSSFFAIYFVII